MVQAGINLAYQMAEQAYIKDGINRVVLATDGDFNVGTVNFEALIDMVEGTPQARHIAHHAGFRLAVTTTIN